MEQELGFSLSHQEKKTIYKNMGSELIALYASKIGEDGLEKMMSIQADGYEINTVHIYFENNKEKMENASPQEIEYIKKHGKFIPSTFEVIGNTFNKLAQALRKE